MSRNHQRVDAMNQIDFIEELREAVAAIDRALADENRQPVSKGRVLSFPIDRLPPAHNPDKVFSAS